MRRAARLLLAALALAAAGPLRAAAGPVAATGLALSAGPERAELRLDFDAPVAWDAYLAADPPRLVLDLPRVEWRLDAPAPAGLVRDLRWGLAAPDRSRLVAELAGPARLEAGAEATEDGFRLALRLQAADRLEDARALAAPAGPAAAPLVVAVDPGHGGRDPGATRAGLREKDLTLAVARVVAGALRERGFEVVLTRERDEFVPLAARVARARAAGAGLLLSLHADALAEGLASGASVYVHADSPSDARAAALAARENAAPGAALPGGGPLAAAGSDVAALLVALARPHAGAASRRFGEALVEALSERAGVLHAQPLREADFRVLAAPEIPAVLLELGFLSTPEDRERLVDPRWRAATAEAAADAVERWSREAR